MPKSRITLTWNDLVRIHRGFIAVEGALRQAGEAGEAGNVQGLNSRFYALLQMTREDSGILYNVWLENKQDTEALQLSLYDVMRVELMLRSVASGLAKDEKNLEAREVERVVEKILDIIRMKGERREPWFAIWPDGMPRART